MWTTDNPHATRSHAYQERFSVNLWAGIVNDFFINPYLLPTRPDDNCYRIYLEKVLPELLQVVPIAFHNRLWFQHDEAPVLFSTVVRKSLDAAFGARWIGHTG